MDSEMTVKVLSINQKTSDIIEVCLSLAKQKYQFLFTLERDETEPQLMSIIEESRFSQFFMFNVHISSQILQLVIKVMNREVINFPVDVGCFYDRKEAIAQQKPFDRELIERK